MKKLYISRLISCVLVILITSIFSININAQIIDVTGNSITIPDGSTVTDPSDHTDFENSTSRTFKISKVGRNKPSVSSIVLSNTTDFTITSNPTPANRIANSINFTIAFNSTTTCGTYTSLVTIDTDATNTGRNGLWTFTISATVAPEIDILDISLNPILDLSANSPSTANNTDFGSIGIGSSTAPFSYTIQNNGICNLDLTGAPLVLLSNTTDFTVNFSTTNTTVSNGSSTNFSIVFNPTTAGVITSTVSIANNDSDENPYTFTVQGTGITPQPEINIQGNATSIINGDNTPASIDDTKFNAVNIGTPITHTFTIQNTGSVSLSLTGAPLVAIGGDAEFTISAQPSVSSIAASSSTTFIIQFNPTDSTTKTATISIANNDGDENPYTFTIEGSIPNLDTFGPGGEWKYLDDGSDQGTAWHGTGFDDSSWASGDAELGFGDGDETTTVANVSQMTTYFRKTFSVSAAETAFTNMVFDLTYDDGAVIYLNGVEVWAVNMPAGRTYLTAASADSGDNATATVNLTNALVAGNNTVAVEIHQRTATSTDISFDLDLHVENVEPTIVDPSGLWSYLDDGTDQGTAWHGTTFDYSSWATGNAELGYGEGDEATVVSYGPDPNNKFITTYFRKSFTATAADVAKSTLVMNAVRDDGMVVYINGVEVWRNNMPLGTILSTTYASGTVSAPDESTWFTNKIANILVEGNNEIGVEIHQVNDTSTDLSFNFSLLTNDDYVYVPPPAPDRDGDNVADYIDSDDDTDGIPDIEEGCYTANFEALNTTGSEQSMLTSFPVVNHPMDDGNTVTITNTGVFDDITSYLAGEHGYAMRIHGPGTSGTITFDFATDVYGLFFKLVDFDENETWTVDIYDETNTLVDLSTSNNIYHIGSYIQQAGNEFDDIYNGTATNNNGDVVASDALGSVYFYFPTSYVSRIVFSVEQPQGATIRIAAMHYCGNDTDGDGLNDYNDSDSDNDGIPDLVEAGGTDIDGDGVIDDTLDTDGDGLADTYDITPNVYFAEEITTLIDYDIDEDGVPSRLDLDSDNDGILDVIEAGESDVNRDGQIDGFIDSNSDGYHDPIDGVNALLKSGIDTDSDGVPNSYPNANQDGSGLPDFMDIDSDDDGITDTVEGQATAAYIAYSTTESDGDGVLNIYDNYSGFGANGVIPIDTDFDCIPDYLDTNSDNDTEDDSIEGHDTNGDGLVNGSDSPTADTGLFTGVDSDNDGLDNGYDNSDATFNASNSSLLPTSHPIFDSGYDRDWRSSNSPIDFDGVNDFIDFGKTLDLSSSFTIEAWVLQKSTASNLGTIISRRDAKLGNESGFHLAINSSNRPNLTWYDSSNSKILDITSPYAIANNKWHHIAASYDGTTAAILIDGVEVVSGTQSTKPSSGVDTKFMVGAMFTSDNNCGLSEEHFHGHIDEVRIWNIGLDKNQIREMMNQEIENNSGVVRGSVVPLDISGPISWSNLIAYYKFNDDKAEDLSVNSYNGVPKNILTIQIQNAPLPYTTKAGGIWKETSGSTPWFYGDSVWNIPNSLSVDGSTMVDWNIVKSDHDVTIDTYTALGQEIKVLGFIANSNITINGDTTSKTGNGLTITHYLKLDGVLDLNGESQLIQTEGSILDQTSSGSVERNQQGTADTFIYNYWSSPVGVINTSSNNNSYTLPDVMRDGNQNINWLTSGYNGTDTTPVGLADYWVWKYANQLNNNYASWQHVRSTGTIQAGEGFTMKGPGSGTPSQDQEYVFVGKPNNGDINLTLSSGNDYLIGNPYASAIDVNEFILDNTSTGAGRASTDIIDGALYFWEHFANATHNLAEYEGGYATRNLIDGVKAISNHILVNNSGVVGDKKPERYIPVSQGFFVIADAGGSISFKNSQRVFQKEESGSSIFMKTSEKNTAGSGENADTRQKIWLMFDSSNGYHRQILAGVDENATEQVDIGYDAKLTEDNSEDMFWDINNDKFVIQGVSNFNTTQVLPLGLKTNTEGEITIRIDELQNILESTDIYINDTELGTYHDLRENDFSIYLTSGIHTSRFELVFETESALGLNDDMIESIDLHYSNSNETIILVNPNYLQIDTIELFDMLGKSILQITEIPVENTVEIKASNLSSGTYILKASAEFGITTKKVIIN